MHGNASQDSLKRNKKILIILISVMVCLILYLLVIQPFLARYFFPPIRTEGLLIYSEKEYLEFENGERFGQLINSMNFPKEFMEKNFYHYDNSKKDSLIYGKVPDIFVLEFELDEQMYYEIRSTYENKHQYLGSEINKFAFYKIDNALLSENEASCIGFNDSEMSMRFLYISDMIGEDSTDNIFLTISNASYLFTY